jgi:hypothetical protein
VQAAFLWLNDAELLTLRRWLAGAELLAGMVFCGLEDDLDSRLFLRCVDRHHLN